MMAARDLKASMGRGNEIPQSREEYLKQKKALEEVSNVTPVVEEKVIETPKTISNPTMSINTPQAQTIANNNAEYVRKGYYHLTEENYWYLKDITFYKNIQIQDYLNQMIELDRNANKDILHFLPHCKQFKNGENI